MTLTPRDVSAVMAAFDASDWDEMTLVLDGATVQLSKTGPPSQAPTAGLRTPPAQEARTAGPPADVAAPPAVEPVERPSEQPPEDTSHMHRTTSPTVGVFWRSPEPSAPPFVEVGQRVQPEDPVCIVEVMKLFNHVQAGVSGVVRAIEAENGAMVEHGQALFLIDVDG